MVGFIPCFKATDVTLKGFVKIHFTPCRAILSPHYEVCEISIHRTDLGKTVSKTQTSLCYGIYSNHPLLCCPAVFLNCAYAVCYLAAILI